MKRSLLLPALALLLCGTQAQAQLYKWVGPDGKINYTDTPPPASVKQVEKKSNLGGGPNYADLPYELAEVSKNQPVTLYSSAKCSPCDDGRKLLNTRGIPFAEKTVTSNEDIEQLKQVSGEAQLPVLIVGRNKQAGFLSSAWSAALTAAGYPESSKLPKNFSNGPAEPAVPPKPLAAKSDKQEGNGNTPARSPSTDLPPATGNAPPGFRF